MRQIWGLPGEAAAGERELAESGTILNSKAIKLLYYCWTQQLQFQPIVTVLKPDAVITTTSDVHKVGALSIILDSHYYNFSSSLHFKPVVQSK